MILWRTNWLRHKGKVLNVRRIAVITGTMAEYGLMYWIIKGIHEAPMSIEKALNLLKMNRFQELR
ncbi:hypothetical protein S225a_15650 [Candidatus Brocadiaceae bacterium S225]|uniref:Uncharacterized protein n=1 Tax=Candidatus Scalindua brodae TaxID=237368 RepID=A0A0B0EAW6_9BACT|nr:MAG: hypothetical protein SCABRO_03795 [Candidatus Scalindua brodae]TWU33115.1 hypothetical protein S225a_15650 [Candidatus Brocadiaceae bacterium S225]